MPYSMLEIHFWLSFNPHLALAERLVCHTNLNISSAGSELCCQSSGLGSCLDGLVFNMP